MANKVGRPATKADEYDPIYNTMLIEHMAKGLSYESFAGKIGTYRSMLYEWEKIYPEFRDTVKRAKEISQLWWEEAGVNGLYTVVENGEGGQVVIEKKINASMWIFNMKARFRWRDRDEEQKGPEKIEEKKTLSIDEKRQLLIAAEREIEKLRQEVKEQDLISYRDPKSNR